MSEEASKKVKPETQETEVKTSAETESQTKEEKKTVRRNKKKTVVSGCVYVNAGFNNTIVTITDSDGKAIAWATAGSCGFKGSKKATPFAAQMAAENAAEKAKAYGFEKADVYVKGVGHGREQALRGLIAQGITILKISDTTPIPHNGCRKPRIRRV